ncbi:MAG: LolA family protein [Alphaproteobacteria bacterium]
MFKKSHTKFLAILLSVWGMFALSASALTAKEKQTLEFLASEFNKVSTVKANFSQTSSRGGSASGRLLMSRPGKMRMQYDTPVSDAALIVNSGVTLWWEAGKKRNIPTGQTPIKAMVQKNFSFFDNDIKILDYNESGNNVSVTMQWKPRPQDGYLTVTMTKNKPVVIKGWSMSDTDGNVVNINLSNIQFGVSAPNKYFQVNTPVSWPK